MLVAPPFLLADAGLHAALNDLAAHGAIGKVVIAGAEQGLIHRISIDFHRHPLSRQ